MLGLIKIMEKTKDLPCKLDTKVEVNNPFKVNTWNHTFQKVINIIDKQVLNFDTDPHNVWARINNEEIMRE